MARKKENHSEKEWQELMDKVAERDRQNTEQSLMIHKRLRSSFDDYRARKKADPTWTPPVEVDNFRYTREDFYKVIAICFNELNYYYEIQSIKDHLNPKMTSQVPYKALVLYSELFEVRVEYLLSGTQGSTEPGPNFFEQLLAVEKQLHDAQVQAEGIVYNLAEVGYRMQLDSLYVPDTPLDAMAHHFVEVGKDQNQKEIDRLKEENKRLKAQLEKEEKTK